jgi:two-component system, NarL family, sensor kinase
MWILSKQSKQLALAHSELELLISERTAELQALSQRLLRVQDEERRKIARDLHDTTGQTLAALKISITMLEDQCQHLPAALPTVRDVSRLADQALEEIRTMSYLLHPPLLDEVGFSCAAAWYIEGFAKRSGISIKADFATSPERLPKRMEIVLFRVLQESLTNVHRHSDATNATISLQHDPQTITLEIRDFGKGISAERLPLLRGVSAETGVGLAGLTMHGGLPPGVNARADRWNRGGLLICRHRRRARHRRTGFQSKCTLRWKLQPLAHFRQRLPHRHFSGTN